MRFTTNGSLLSTILLVVLALILGACTPASPTPGSARGFAYIWYVALSGDNDNSCDNPAQPCRTLEGALAKARATNALLADDYPGETVTVFHTVHVAAGTYNETALNDGYPFAYGNINVTVIGEGEGSTIFDAGDQYGGLAINGDVQVTLRDLTIQNVNGHAPDSCVNIRGAAVVTLEDVTLRHCVRSGVAHTSSAPLTLIDVTATDMLDDGGGNGVGVSSLGELIIEGGSFSSNGGTGIRSHGSLTATGVLVERNQRDGIVLIGSATLSDVTIRQNGQDTSFRAGLRVSGVETIRVDNSSITDNQFGVYVDGPRLYLTDTTVTGNPRTGIYVDAGELRLNDSTVENNASFYAGTSLGGGIHVEAGARAILRSSQVLGNHNGGIQNLGELFLIDSAVTGNFAGLPAINNYPGAVAIIERSLIADNQPGDRVVSGQVTVDNRGTMNIVNSTFSGNQGDGLSNSGFMNLAFSTVAFNTGYGFLSSETSDASPWLANNVIAGNGTDCYVPSSPSAPGRLTLAGTNIESDGSCGFSASYALADLLLDALADNGGPTMTHALLSGSPAIDASSGSCPPNDQRSLARPYAAACDAGAYEAGSTVLRISDEATDFDPEDFATATPAAGATLIAIPDQNYNCRYGNSTAFDIADTLLQGQEYQPLAKGNDNLWLQFAGPSFGELCWAPASGFTLYLDGAEVALLDLPLDLLGIKAYPAAPTATPDPDESYDVTPTPPPSPTPTCDPQQQQQCP